MSNKQAFLKNCQVLTTIIKKYTKENQVFIYIDDNDCLCIFSSSFANLSIRIGAEKELLNYGNILGISPPVSCFNLTQLALNPLAKPMPEFLRSCLPELIVFAELDQIKGIVSYLNDTHIFVETILLCFATNFEKLVDNAQVSCNMQTAQTLLYIDNIIAVIEHFLTSIIAQQNHLIVKELICKLPALSNDTQEIDTKTIQDKLITIILLLNANNTSLSLEILNLLNGKGYQYTAEVFTQKMLDTDTNKQKLLTLDSITHSANLLFSSKPGTSVGLSNFTEEPDIFEPPSFLVS